MKWVWKRLQESLKDLDQSLVPASNGQCVHYLLLCIFNLCAIFGKFDDFRLLGNCDVYIL